MIARIDVGPFVTIYFHSNEMFVDNFRNLDIFIALAVDDVAPVAPDGADVEEDGLVFGFGAFESVIAPFVPINGLVRGGTQVGAGGIFQAVFRMVGQRRSQFEAAKSGQLRSFALLRMTPDKSAGPKPGHYTNK